jgi:dTDP-4-dehydrorhamnose 3,5-epimerase
MQEPLSPSQISDQYVNDVYTQEYGAKQTIDGVKVVDLKTMAADDGDFGEIFRLNENGHLEMFPDFQLRQINRTNLFPGSVKAWHMHFRQEEIWSVSANCHIVAGLWDLRKGSPTEGVKQRIVLGGGMAKLLYIPKGVAHGSANFSTEDVQLLYFVNQVFDVANPDERRVHWDILGKEFWTPERD